MKAPKNKKALAATLIFHAILLVVFLFVGLTQPDPIPEEIGVEIAMADLGNSFTGSGNAPTPQVNNNPTPQPAATTPTQVSNSSAQQEEVVTEEASDVATPSAKEPESNPEPVKEIPKEKVEEQPKRQVNKQALYPGKSDNKATDAQGGSQGNREGKGDAGSEDGKPKGKGILGGGMGSWELSGRSLVQGTTIEDTREEGTVVLNIWVDRYGKVSRTSPNLAESTTTSQYLFDLAAKAAKRSKYSQKSDAAVEQKGKMTFKFILE